MLNHVNDPVDSPALWRARSNMTRARMEVLIEEVSAKIQRRMEEEARAAKKFAKDLRHISEDAAEVMEIDVAQDCDAPAFFALCDALRGLAVAADTFEPVFRRFVARHGVLLEKEAEQNIDTFLVWIRRQRDRIGALCATRAREYSDGVAAVLAEEADLVSDLARLRDVALPGELDDTP